MKILVEHTRHGTTTPDEVNMSFISFFKSAAFYGVGNESRNGIFRGIGFFLQNRPYLNIQEFNDDHFKKPEFPFNDSSEIGVYSYRLGMAIGDFLGKYYERAKFSIFYSSLMKREFSHVSFQRRVHPDLIFFDNKNNSMFSMEAKGFTSSRSLNQKKLTALKNKAKNVYQKISIRFSIACVSKGLYSKIKVNYTDPPGDITKESEELVRNEFHNYYDNWSNFIQEHFEIFNYLVLPNRRKYGLYVPKKDNKCLFQLLDIYNLSLLVDTHIEEYKDMKFPEEDIRYPKKEEHINNEEHGKDNIINYIFIDSDGIGFIKNNERLSDLNIRIYDDSPYYNVKELIDSQTNIPNEINCIEKKIIENSMIKKEIDKDLLKRLAYFTNTKGIEKCINYLINKQKSTINQSPLFNNFEFRQLLNNLIHKKISTEKVYSEILQREKKRELEKMKKQKEKEKERMRMYA